MSLVHKRLSRPAPAVKGRPEPPRAPAAPVPSSRPPEPAAAGAAPGRQLKDTLRELIAQTAALREHLESTRADLRRMQAARAAPSAAAPPAPATAGRSLLSQARQSSGEDAANRSTVAV